jgi:hypothetical protein
MSGTPRSRTDSTAFSTSYSVPEEYGVPSLRLCLIGSSGVPRRDHRMQTSTSKFEGGGICSWKSLVSRFGSYSQKKPDTSIRPANSAAKRRITRWAISRSLSTSPGEETKMRTCCSSLVAITVHRDQAPSSKIFGAVGALTTDDRTRPKSLLLSSKLTKLLPPADGRLGLNLEYRPECAGADSVAGPNRLPHSPSRSLTS